ncbi:hypothetical protein DZC30_20135 [Comamonas testosteroni]|uniref:Uncharacterized protein n=1 Tax=Comamonas testosteroni TaxID=285 RepID=A0A373F8W3_COMTE|nr:hypothetical protein DZC30_20135 [Comamonas testosteroni]
MVMPLFFLYVSMSCQSYSQATEGDFSSPFDLAQDAREGFKQQFFNEMSFLSLIYIDVML